MWTERISRNAEKMKRGRRCICGDLIPKNRRTCDLCKRAVILMTNERWNNLRRKDARLGKNSFEFT